MTSRFFLGGWNKIGTRAKKQKGQKNSVTVVRGLCCCLEKQMTMKGKGQESVNCRKERRKKPALLRMCEGPDGYNSRMRSSASCADRVTACIIQSRSPQQTNVIHRGHLTTGQDWEISMSVRGMQLTRLILNQWQWRRWITSLSLGLNFTRNKSGLCVRAQKRVACSHNSATRNKFKHGLVNWLALLTCSVPDHPLAANT